MLHCFLHQQVWEIAPTDSMAIAGGRLLVILMPISGVFPTLYGCSSLLNPETVLMPGVTLVFQDNLVEASRRSG